MRLVFVNTLRNGWGGSEELWFLTVLACLKAGHEVMVLAFSSNDQNKIDVLKQNGAEVIVRNSFHYNENSFILRQLERIKKFFIKPKDQNWLKFEQVFRFRPDGIIISQSGTYQAVLDNNYMRLVVELGVPYFLISQHNFENGVFDFKNSKDIRIFLQGAQKFFFVSERNLKVAQRQLACTLENAVVISNPVNLRSRDKIDWPTSSVLKLACVARLDCNFKGQDLLVEALSADVWRKREWQLTFYGKGVHEQYLKELVEYFGLNHKVVFQGHVTDISSLWAENHMLVLPSISEGTPLSLIEAMTCGRPAVVTDVGDNARVIQHGQSGFVIQAPTVKLIQEALELAWSKRESWEQMGNRAHLYAIENVERDPASDLLNRIIESL